MNETACARIVEKSEKLNKFSLGYLDYIETAAAMESLFNLSKNILFNSRFTL